MFDYSQPCRASESVDLPIDTTPLRDGQHTLKVSIEDAAQNSSVIYDAAITTDNAPANSSAPTVLAPSQPLVAAALSSNPGTWSAPTGAGTITYSYQWEDCNPQGTNCTAITGAQTASYTPTPNDADHTLRLLVNAANNDGTTSAISTPTGQIQASQGPLTSTPGPGTSAAPGGPPAEQISTPNGTAAGESAQLRLAVTRTISRTYTHRALRITGQLHNNQGTPITGATLDILEQIAGTNHLHILTHTNTTTNGSFLATVPPGPSRRIQIAYRAFTTDATYAATATIKESVRAGVRLNITPRHTTPTGTITLTGKVAGPIPHQGILVELRVHYRGHWQTFWTPTTNSNGSFTVEYQFQEGVGHFPFRAAVPAGQTNFPYAAGHSRTIDISTS